MGNPIKDTVDDFASFPKGMAKKHAEMLNKMIMKDLEKEPFDISELGMENLKFTSDTDINAGYNHTENIKRMKKTEAVKSDKDKTRMDLLPPKALEGIAKIFTFGAKKYNDYNYKNGEGLDWSRPYAAMIRHLNAWNDGEDKDPETGQSHLYHAGCCIMMLIDLVDSEIGKDTRF